MNASEESAASLLRLEERLRQERETFDQRKDHEERWFNLKLRMGYIAAVMLPGIAIVCVSILINHAEFAPEVIVSSGVALAVDLAGFLAAVWKVGLGQGSITRLEPTVPLPAGTLNKWEGGDVRFESKVDV